MSQLFEQRFLYNQDGFYPPQSPGSSEWTVSSSAGTPMSREPSGESSITSCSSELVESPSSEYGVYSSAWSSMPLDNHDYLWSPLSDPNNDIAFSHMSYNPPYISNLESIAGNENDYNTSGQNNWWDYYDFIAMVDPGQQAYWKLKPGLRPTAQHPATRAAEDISAMV